MALDVGDARIGVAIANLVAKLPSPLAIVKNDSEVFDNLELLARQNDVSTIVIGLPRDMQGEETAQSENSRKFAAKLENYVKVPIVFADESLSTKRAESYGAKNKRTDKHLDDIAACFILEEYLAGNNI